MGKYREPEGYILDERTGLYYSQIIGVDETGSQMQIVTWFNTESGEYSQYTYPIENADITAHSSMQHVSQNISDTQSFEESKLLEAPPEPEIQITNIKADKEYENERLHTKSKRGDSRKAYLPIIGALLVIFVVVLVVKGLSDKNAANGKEVNVMTENTENTENTAVVEETDAFASEGAALSSEIASNSDSNDEKSLTEESSSIYPFPNYATCNYVTQLADEDEQFVYAIRVDMGGWMYNGGLPSGNMIRFPKTGGEPELFAEAMDGIYSIAVMGDYVYYSVNYGGDYTYCRKNKNTGEEEQLFNEDYSLLQAYDGKIYLFFAENGRQDIGIYDPITAELSLQTTDYALTMATGIGGKQSVKAFSPFSIYNGCLYYGGWGDYTICYGKYDFSNGQTQILSTTDASDLIDAGYSEYMFDYIDRFGYCPNFINDYCEINAWDVCIMSALLENGLFFYECDYDTQFFTVDGNGYKTEYFAFNDKVPCLAEEVYLNGVSQNWVIYNDRALQIDLEGIVNEVSFEKIY